MLEHTVFCFKIQSFEGKEAQIHSYIKILSYSKEHAVIILSAKNPGKVNANCVQFTRRKYVIIGTKNVCIKKFRLRKMDIQKRGENLRHIFFFEYFQNT